ncbi:MAG: alpha/beta fold hydrolase [Acidimicrobiales bacterium]
MHGVTTTTVELPGHSTPLCIGGDRNAPALLWLHGEGLTSGWGELHDRLASHFRLYAPVLPGFGGTALPAWVDTADDVALHLADLCRHLDLHTINVAGESLGGWIAMSLAIWRPQLVASLGLVGALGWRPLEPAPDLFIKSGPEALGYLSNQIDAAAADPLTGDLDLATALWVEQAAQARLMWERPYDRKLAQRCHHISAAVHVVWGGADRVLPPSHAEELAAALAATTTTTTTIVPGAGHLLSLDAPAELAEALRKAFA